MSTAAKGRAGGAAAAVESRSPVEATRARRAASLARSSPARSWGAGAAAARGGGGGGRQPGGRAGLAPSSAARRRSVAALSSAEKLGAAGAARGGGGGGGGFAGRPRTDDRRRAVIAWSRPDGSGFATSRFSAVTFSSSVIEAIVVVAASTDASKRKRLPQISKTSPSRTSRAALGASGCAFRSVAFAALAWLTSDTRAFWSTRSSAWRREQCASAMRTSDVSARPKVTVAAALASSGMRLPSSPFERRTQMWPAGATVAAILGLWAGCSVLARLWAASLWGAVRAVTGHCSRSASTSDMTSGAVRSSIYRVSILNRG